MKLVLVAAALSAVSYAQLDMSKVTDCDGLFSDCRTGPNANQATCVAAKAQCDQCQVDYSTCRSPGNGATGNQAGCAAQVASCVGSAFPGLVDGGDSDDDSDDCQTTYNSCVAGGTSQELCSCDLAVCTGEDNARTRAYCAQLSASSAPGPAATAAAPASGTASSAPAAATDGSGDDHHDSDDCRVTFDACVAGGRSEELCGCDLAVCSGEDSARGRAYCASLSATMATATATPAASGPAAGAATSGAARPTSAVGGVGGNSTSPITPIVTGSAASVGVSLLGAASAFVSYLLM